ncbi:hypothetical protein LEP1GSC047_2520 [Leptospira inadai serovar Lyme str. 10]|uniref:Uncharacterized protein n=2 Tax=Leptospira inadai serovar Lyme TaxID=293084 RepID=V6HBT7_9LEPT|nr:hypothetical protein [Leptospira inadai]EQA36942.1 hypothetical protein LEP1GSC047_2520 [Leptospira inadai serovar Lyme str. 10]PNV75697.1 hypothetical protein BES34_006555 [Leptospira inadai serovar Lyme]
MDEMVPVKRIPRRCIHYIAFIILGVAAYVVPTFPVQAQITCTPPLTGNNVCTIIPANIQADFNGLQQAIQTQYLNEITKSMANAAVMSNINASMMGPGTVNRFQIGAGISAGGVKNSDITVSYNGTTLPAMPNVGASINPSLMLGVNLGWLLGKGQSDQPDKSDTVPESQRSFLHRLNFYVHGFHGNIGSGDLKSLTHQASNGLHLDGSANSFGATLRFQLARERYTRLDFFGFTGLSLGVGFHRQDEGINIVYAPGINSAAKVNFGSASGRWDETVTFAYRNKVQSVPVDIRTGVRLFYFLTIFAGGGISNNTGYAKVNLDINGPLYLAANIPSSSGLPAAVIQQLNGGASGTLRVHTGGSAYVKSQTSYILGGFEINLLTFKILAEGMMTTDKLYSANLGVKFAL